MSSNDQSASPVTTAVEVKGWQLKGNTFSSVLQIRKVTTRQWVSGTPCGKFFLIGQQAYKEGAEDCGLKKVQQYRVRDVKSIDVTEVSLTRQRSCSRFCSMLCACLKALCCYYCTVMKDVCLAMKSCRGRSMWFVWATLQLLLIALMGYYAYYILPQKGSSTSHHLMTAAPNVTNWINTMIVVGVLTVLLMCEAVLRVRKYRKSKIELVWVIIKIVWFLTFFLTLLGTLFTEIDCPGGRRLTKVSPLSRHPIVSLLTDASPLRGLTEKAAAEVAAPTEVAKFCGIDVPCNSMDELMCKKWEPPEEEKEEEEEAAPAPAPETEEPESPKCKLVDQPLCSSSEDHDSSHGAVLFFNFATWFLNSLVVIVNFIVLCLAGHCKRAPRPEESADATEIQAQIQEAEKASAEDKRVNVYTIFMTNQLQALKFTLGSEWQPSDVLDAIFNQEGGYGSNQNQNQNQLHADGGQRPHETWRRKKKFFITFSSLLLVTIFVSPRFDI